MITWWTLSSHCLMRTVSNQPPTHSLCVCVCVPAHSLCVCCADDGNLSHREFIKVMKSRGSRGLNKVAMHNAVYMYTSGEGHKVSIF